ncbi:hypothetical protein ACFL6X_09615 [Candidatus Latescibacterota bacterium]
MPTDSKITRVGLIGYGQIGTAVREMIDGDSDNGMEIVFVHDQDASRLEGLGDGLALNDLAQFEERQADLVVEMAHLDVTRQWGARILEKTNYMLVSVTAMADAWKRPRSGAGPGASSPTVASSAWTLCWRTATCGSRWTWS